MCVTTSFVNMHVDQGTITIVQVSTKDQLADVMTKIVGKDAFLRFRDHITSDVDLTPVDKRNTVAIGDNH